jgi:hypothetical protein
MLRKPWALLKPFPDEFIGVSLEEATAANSAAAIRVSALQAIGGYDPRFNFDASDWVMFHRLQINNFSVFVAGNIRVEHELSIYDLEHRSTPERYGHMLCVEEAYYHEYGERVEGAVILLKLFYRLIYKIWATGGGLPYFRVCLRFLFRRLFCSRKYRMESWNESVRRNSAA